MRKTVVVMFCVAFLTIGQALAQEVNADANGPSDVSTMTPPEIMEENMENMENWENESVNDEGYGMDDEEYYGGEDEMGNMEENIDDVMPVNEEVPMAEPAMDNAVGQ